MKVLSNENIKFIYHLADIHIRPLDRHDEYNKVFKNLYSYLMEQEYINESVVVICGDIVHEKDKITPELIIVLRNFLSNLSLILPVIFFSGNHDLIENNSDRIANLDALTRDLNNIYYLKYTDLYEYGNVIFSLNSLEDKEYFKSLPDTNKIKIALYHGMLQEISFSKGGISIEDFDKYDFVLLGDVHERQFLKENIAYSGSLIQQNFGESINNHGLIKWDILNNKSETIDIPNEVGYVTINNNELLTFPKYTYLRLNITEDIDVDNIINDVKNKTNILSEKIIKFKNKNDKIEYEEEFIENISDEQIIKDNTEEYKTILDLHKKIKEECDFNNENISEYKWSIQNIEFKNLFIYGNNKINKINFSNKNGIIGILGKNAIGKSTIINILIFALFDKISTEFNSVNIINKNAKDMYVKVEFTIGDILYIIIKEGKLQRYKKDVKTRFITNYMKIENGKEINLNGKDKIKTQQLIENTIGNRDMFLLCNIVSNNNHVSLLNMTSLGAIQTFSNLLSLDKYELLHKNISSKIKIINEELLKEESKYSLLNDITNEFYESLIDNINNKYEKIKLLKKKLIDNEEKHNNNTTSLEDINKNIININKPKNSKEDLLSIKNEISKNLNDYDKNYIVNDTLEYLYHNLYNSNENLEDIEIKLKKLKEYKIRYTDNEYQDLLLKLKIKQNELNKLKNEIRLFNKSDDILKDLDYNTLLEKKEQCRLRYINDYKEIIEINENNYNHLKKIIKECENILFFNCNKISEESKKLKEILKDNKFYCDKNKTYKTEDTNDIIVKLINFFDKIKSSSELDIIRNQLNKNKSEYNILTKQINKNNENNKFNTQIDEDKLYNEKISKELLLINNSINNLKYDEIDSKINNLEIELSKLNEKIQLIKNSIEYFNLKDLYDKLKNNKIINKKIHFLKLNKELELNKIELNEYDIYEKNIIKNKHLEISKKEIEKIIEEYNNNIINYKKEISVLETELKYDNLNKNKLEEDLNLKKELDKNINKCKNKLKIYSIYKKLVDKKGIPSIILQKKLEFIQKDINIKLENLVKFKIKMYIDNESKFNIDIIKFDNILKPYMCSGYERFILNIMIKNSLNRYCYNNKSNIFCIDEGLDCIDDDNLNKFKIVLERLEKTYNHVILISQIDRINKYIDHNIEISYENNSSSIKVF